MTPKQLIEMTNTTEKREAILIEYIRLHAQARYSKGWDPVVEAFTDGDILEYLSDADFNLPKAIKAIEEWLEIRQEMSDNCQF
jgi:hypothetical protein